MTTVQKQPQCMGEKCPCMDECPLTVVFGIVGGKWKVEVVCALHHDGPLRYNALKRKIHGITNTMLASTLKELCEAGLIKRTQYEEMPVRVEYETTPSVAELAPILLRLAEWGMKNRHGAM